MTYPGTFHRLVLIGTWYSDVWNTTLSIIPATGTSLPAVSDSLLASVASAVATWYPKPLLADGSGGLEIDQDVKLTGIKLNRIGPDGRYVDGITKETVYGTPISGGGSGSHHPSQTSLVVTYRGLNERALAGKGRGYWPATLATVNLGTDGLMQTTNCLNSARGMRNLVGILDDVYLAASITAVVGIASKTRTGGFQGINKISVGRVVDTMRSRRNKLLEDPQEISM